MKSNVADLYEFSLLQTVAESYLPPNLTVELAVRDALRLGNNRFGYPNQTGTSRITDPQFRRWTAAGQELPRRSIGQSSSKRTLNGSSIFKLCLVCRR